MTTDYAAVAREWLDTTYREPISGRDIYITDACEEALRGVNRHDPTAVYDAVEDVLRGIIGDPDVYGTTLPDYPEDCIELYLKNRQLVADAFHEVWNPEHPVTSCTDPIEEAVRYMIRDQECREATRLREALPELKARFEELEDAEEEDE